VAERWHWHVVGKRFERAWRRPVTLRTATSLSSAGGNDRLTALSNSASVRPASVVRLADRRARTTISGGSQSIELGLMSGLLSVAPLDFARFARARNWPSMSALFRKDLPDQPPPHAGGIGAACLAAAASPYILRTDRE
jgi:hypothetical protein